MSKLLIALKNAVLNSPWGLGFHVLLILVVVSLLSLKQCSHKTGTVMSGSKIDRKVAVVPGGK